MLLLLFIFSDIHISQHAISRKDSSKIDNFNFEKIQEAQNISSTSKMAVMKNSDVGMLAPKPIIFLLLWYFFSGLTLFFNKYIVATMNGSETLLGK